MVWWEVGGIDTQGMGLCGWVSVHLCMCVCVCVRVSLFERPCVYVCVHVGVCTCGNVYVHGGVHMWGCGPMCLSSPYLTARVRGLFAAPCCGGHLQAPVPVRPVL